MSVQPLLFDLPRQPRLTRREPMAIYLAVLALRKRGKRLYRQGRHEHTIDGKRVSSAILVSLAERRR